MGTSYGSSRACSPQDDIGFVRAAIGDFAHKGRKLVASAQTWRDSSLLLHAAIVLGREATGWKALIRTDPESRESLREKLKSRAISLRKILGREIESHELQMAIKTGMTQALHMELRVCELRPET